MAYGTVNADVIGTSVANSSLGAGNATNFKNRIINGSMTIDQRNAGASVSTPTANAWTYFLDRWAYYCTSSGKYSVQQNAGSVTPPAGFTNYLGVTSLAATTIASSDVYDIRQTIEGFNIADLGWGTSNAKTVTLSFWVRSSLTGQFGGSFGNSALDRIYPFSYTISAANTWEQKSITVTGDTSGTWLTTNGIGISIVFGLGVGSTYLGTAGSWTSTFAVSSTGSTNVVSTNGATWYITGVQLEVGSSATGFEYRDITKEIQLCQRYFEKTYDTNTAVGTATSNGRLAPGSASDNGSNASCAWVFAVEKRAAPTIVPYVSATGASGSWGYERAGSTSTGGTTAEAPGTRGARIYMNVGSANVPVWIYGHATASAEL